MALSKEISAQDSAALTQILNRKRRTSAEKQVAAQRIAAIAQIAHANDIILSRQGDGFTEFLFGMVLKSLTDKRDNRMIAAEMMAKLEQYQQRQTRTNLRSHRLQGAGMGSIALHRAPARSLMTAQQMKPLLPAETPAFQVFGAFNVSLAHDRQTLAQALAAAMQDKRVEAMIIPVVKNNHWRLIAIDKAGKKHQIKVFDSMGQRSAEAMFGDVKRLLTEAQLPHADFDLGALYDNKPQKDGYSCGDYVVAAAHRFAQQYQVAGVNQGLINTFASKGNADGALRFATINMARKQAGLSLIEKPAVEHTRRGTKRKCNESPVLPSNFQNSLDKLFFKPTELTQRPGDRLVTQRFSDFKQNSINKHSAKSAEVQFQEDLDARLARALAAGQTEGMSVADEQRQVKAELAKLFNEQPSSTLTFQ